MAIFQKAERRKAKLRLALCGPSGSGKTYSALKIAKGMGGKIALIDTENGSGLLYSNICDYDAAEIAPPFSVDKYIGAIKEAEKAGYDVLIIDSLTHAFYGFVFSKKRDKDGIISVTAYDQLRYLKNKHVYWYDGYTASNVITNLAKDFQLKIGEIEDTKFSIPARLEDGKTLFDIILNALDITLENTKKLYVLYSDFDKLTLKDIENMKLDLLIDAGAAENFSYTSSIDNNTYNRVILHHEDAKDGERKIYISPQDSKEFTASDNIKQWGVLQFYDTFDENTTNPQAKADALLQLYNKKTRNLSIDNAFGDIRVRAGASIIVKLDLGDITVNNYMLVERVKHVFKNKEHMMNLSLRGGVFVG